MAELATIARPYAEALYKACTGKAGTDLNGACAWVDELAAIAANPQLRQLLDNPKVTAQQLFDVITGVAKTALPEMAHNFLRTLLDNGRVQVLPEIATQFRALVNQGNGSSDAVVYSAFPLDANALAELSATLQKRFARTLNLSVQTDESLIGGVRVVVGDEVLDTSVKARLEQMKAALIA
ncbi:MAG TPA: F0F1 ATP synthase subunit delta [Alicycliphilus sp.]|nr:F0F1 ATP synthase subunit delta [Alicycliphilus sp.]